MVTKLFGAILTIQTRIRFFGEAFGVEMNGELPANEKHEREEKQAPRIEARDKHERREHHREIPIIDAADCTAFILHYPRLERAEKEDAYHITDCICKADQYQYSRIDHFCIV